MVVVGEHFNVTHRSNSVTTGLYVHFTMCFALRHQYAPVKITTLYTKKSKWVSVVTTLLNFSYLVYILPRLLTVLTFFTHFLLPY